jgi:colicin V production protein
MTKLSETLWQRKVGHAAPGLDLIPMLAVIANPQPAPGGASNWQLVFVSLAIVILLLEVIHGWRLGLIRQLVRVIAIIVAYSCGFFAASATVALLRPHLKLPDPILAAIGGAILAFILFAAINLIGAFLFKKTAQQPSPAMRLIWGITGALLGILLGVFTLWLTFTGIRMVGSIAQARLHTPNPPGVTARPNGTVDPAASLPPPNPLMTMLADMKSSLESGHVGAAVRAADPLPSTLYRGLEKAGEVASNPECAERFLSFPGAREISEHPRVVALRNDQQVMQLIASGKIFELMKNQRMIDALNDPSLQARIKKFDLERALDYALQKNGNIIR